MVAFIDNSRLGGYLRQQDWSGFAYRYNGTDFRKNRYDTRLAQAHARYTAGPLPDLRVRATQLYLMFLGFAPGSVDGWFGRNTQKALMRFQAAHAQPATGVLDPATFAALEQAALF